VGRLSPPPTVLVRESYPLTRNSATRITRIFYGKVLMRFLRNSYVYDPGVPLSVT
jgi:hypothetical protein